MFAIHPAAAMARQKLRLRLLTPCFLGDADQSGAWRTPPFKALLREWWRIAAAAPRYDHHFLREQEGELFGNAWLTSGASKSRVRLALEHWKAGKLTAFGDDPKVKHDNVKFPVGSQLYLGYGPMVYDKISKKTALKANPALQADEGNTLSVAWPESEPAVEEALQLIDWFGSIGGRSRNGWGALELAADGGPLALVALASDHQLLQKVLRPLRGCLQLDWPHAIGSDTQGPLIWHSVDSFANWSDAMRFLARTKIGFRTHLPFSGGGTHRQPQERHVLAYPVTNHQVQGWGGNTRLANQLRFKVIRENGRLRARIYHTPHQSPLPMPGIDQHAVWQKLHRWLDDPAHQLQRLGGAA